MDPVTAMITDVVTTEEASTCIATAAELLCAWIPCEAVGRNLLDATSLQMRVAGFPDQLFSADPGPRVLASAQDNPMITSHLSEPLTALPLPRRLSDLIGLSEWHETRSYQDVLRDYACDYQIAAGVNGPGYRTAWALNRTLRDFTDGELDRLRRIQPMLALLDQSLTGRAGRPPIVEHPDLTTREQQVLQVMSDGLTAAACGRLLGISTRTVTKHLENVYRKLQCNTLVAAVSITQSWQ
jgi:DNA-binding CsgD family transcriptional regulator